MDDTLKDPKDLKSKKISLKLCSRAMIDHLAIFNNRSMQGSSFKQMNSANYYKIQKTALKGLFCLSQSNPAPAILSVLYFTQLRFLLLFCVRNRNFHSAVEKQNYVTENEKNSDYYYLRDRKMIKVVFSSQVSLLAFYFRENFKHKSLFSLVHYNIIMGL